MREPGQGDHDERRPAVPGVRSPAPETHRPIGDEFDSPAEVDAAFTTQRRLAFGYFLVFLVVTFAAPALSLTLGWWSEARIVGGMSPNFLVAAVGLYVFFFLLGLWAARQAQAVEDRMLGSADDEGGA